MISEIKGKILENNACIGCLPCLTLLPFHENKEKMNNQIKKKNEVESIESFVPSNTLYVNIRCIKKIQC